MALNIECKNKIFLQYVSSSVTLNFHLVEMTLYIECKDKVFLWYGSSSVALSLRFCEIDFGLWVRL